MKTLKFVSYTLVIAAILYVLVIATRSGFTLAP